MTKVFPIVVVSLLILGYNIFMTKSVATSSTQRNVGNTRIYTDKKATVKKNLLGRTISKIKTTESVYRPKAGVGQVYAGSKTTVKRKRLS